MKYSIIFLNLLVLLGISACKKNDEVADELKVYDLSEVVNGKTQSDLSIEATKYYYPLDFDTSPLNDPDGSLTAKTKQPLDGFTILPTNIGGVTNRSLTIPSSKPVFFPILGNTVWYYENDPCDPDKPKSGQSIKDYLLEYIEPYFLDKNVQNLSATLNGKPLVTNLKAYKTNSETFKMKVPPAVAGDYCPRNTNDAICIATGYNLLIKIPKGKHVLAYKGDILDADGIKENDFHTEVIWNLTVE